MRLLICAQVVDKQDPTLGFFNRWIEEFAKHVESIVVICLKEGEHDLPSNVKVLSLGKEGGGSRFKYITRFYKYIWHERKNYDSVFVHMNQEYILLAGVFWKLLRKRIYMWRNHYAGNVLTDIAAFFCDKVFCTSKHSYTAKYKKTELMPVGVDLERFFPDESVHRAPNSILFLARISPSKRVEILIDALEILSKKGVNFTANIVGSPLPKDEKYYESLKKLVHKYNLEEVVKFLPGVSNNDTVKLYQSHEIFVNTSPSGMFDKTMFEAAASGCLVLTSSKDFTNLAGDDTYFDSSESLADCLRKTLSSKFKLQYDSMLAENSLTMLVNKVVKSI